ncbi:hypothetical protein [Gracilibacillus phocaeensis]|uniref:hypothetical protein n=1 Tax=Gracilibacillus phocaeensis TaxID=2042304 RepID=UPI0010320EDF|nr:hypothetical protein [Gracilibacillus phocaeensis]
MSATFYKRAFIIDLIMIGIIRFAEITFFDFSNTGKITEAILYIIAIFLLVMFVWKKSKSSKSNVE